MKYEQLWLAYHRIEDYADKKYFQTIYVPEGKESKGILAVAAEELEKAAEEILGITPKVLTVGSGTALTEEKTADRANGIHLCLNAGVDTGEEGYTIEEENGNIVIQSAGERGLLYGSFSLIRHVQRKLPLKQAKWSEIPDNPLRMLNHWDNMDGSIERGYAGQSFFFQNDQVLVNERTKCYARLAASVGINGVVINNVNVKNEATNLITLKHRTDLKQMAVLFQKYGIKLFLSLNFAAPIELGGLDTADPLDETVKDWWKKQLTQMYEDIPELGGFLVKADSEGRPGPFTYGRTHAEGANMLAEAVEPYGGLIIWRCFVYNCQQDWRDRKTDRARAGYDHFMPLDGQFAANVILQIKNGPMDFQVREPVSPLFGGLECTNQMLEVQIAQEYTGQQRHVCYLLPMFQQVLGFHTYCTKETDRVADLVSGRTYGNKNCGIVAVANMGNDTNWTGHDLAAANLYGFGRLSFQTNLDAEEIAREWVECTFGQEQRVIQNICRILMMSWPAYEKYTSPLGIGWMVNPHHHYGPNVDGYEYDRWGTYHRADREGIGVDRGPNGTGYAEQYREPNASIYGNISSCPDELLLFFHHVPYSYVLKSGKTVIQHIYDTHFEGVEDAEKMKSLWEELKGIIPEEIYNRVLARLSHQVEHAKEWRDQINTYFYRKSYIGDKGGREIYP